MAVIGDGPAGLTGAYELDLAGVDTEVFEASDALGGISRTVERDGWRFDIGGHRFFTTVPAVERLLSWAILALRLRGRAVGLVPASSTAFASGTPRRPCPC